MSLSIHMKNIKCRVSEHLMQFFFDGQMIINRPLGLLESITSSESRMLTKLDSNFKDLLFLTYLEKFIKFA